MLDWPALVGFSTGALISVLLVWYRWRLGLDREAVEVPPPFHARTPEREAQDMARAAELIFTYVSTPQDATPQDATWSEWRQRHCAHDGNTSVDYRLCSTIERRHCDDCGATL